jgi:hypothetical protein
MSLVCPDSAEILMLQYIVNMTSPDNRLLKLFKNNVTPGESTVIGTLTEATQAGYAPVTLVGSSWTTTQSSGVTTAVYSERTFTFTTGATIYGYYITTMTNALLWVERFSGAPFTLPDGGGEIAISPRLTLE